MPNTEIFTMYKPEDRNEYGIVTVPSAVCKRGCPVCFDAENISSPSWSTGEIIIYVNLYFIAIWLKKGYLKFYFIL